jgi:SHS2 domain-containing protein
VVTTRARANGLREVAIQHFREIEHTADWAFRAHGTDMAELFANAGRAIFELQVTGGSGETPVAREVAVSGVDRETLLVNWLNELLYLQETQHEMYSRFEILELSDTHLRARVHGWPHRPERKLIKAVTFHNLEVKHSQEGWEAMIVVDV